MADGLPEPRDAAVSLLATHNQFVPYYTDCMSQADARELLPVSPGRSGCPINMTVELLGDGWSLVVLRDVMFGARTRFRELLTNSVEGIASNILAARLAKLVKAGLLTQRQSPEHRQGIDYHLTEAAIQLVPVFAHIGAWGSQWLPTSPELSIRAQLLADGGPEMWTRFMDELRDTHLHRRPPAQDGVLAELTAAYQRIATS